MVVECSDLRGTPISAIAVCAFANMLTLLGVPPTPTPLATTDPAPTDVAPMPDVVELAGTAAVMLVEELAAAVVGPMAPPPPLTLM